MSDKDWSKATSGNCLGCEQYQALLDGFCPSCHTQGEISDLKQDNQRLEADLKAMADALIKYSWMYPCPVSSGSGSTCSSTCATHKAVNLAKQLTNNPI